MIMQQYSILFAWSIEKNRKFGILNLKIVNDGVTYLYDNNDTKAYLALLKVDENNKVIGGNEAYTIKVVDNPARQEKEIVGDNPISLKLVQDREQDER